MNKKKVLVIGALPPPYMGPTLATQVILGSFIKDRFEISHLDTSDHRDLETLGSFDFTNIWLGIKSYIDMLVMIIRNRPALTYMQISQTTIGYLRDSIYIILSWIFRIRILCHLRGGNFKIWYDGCHPLMKWYIRRVHSLVDGQIVLGERLRPLFAGLVTPDRIYVVPNGKDLDYVPRTGKNSTFRVLFAGNMKETKGALDTLYASEIVCKSINDIEFHFVGGWVEKQTKSTMDEFLANNPQLPVTLRGPLIGEEKDNAFLDADLFVFPTFYPPEGHPWVIVEAMAAGLPIISTDHAAIPESVIDGHNGLIVDKRNPEKLAAAIIQLYQDKKLLRQMGKNSRERYEQNFTEADMIGKISDTIDVLIR